MKSRVLVLGAGFGGLELSTLLSEALGEKADVTVIEQSDAFVFGYSKIDVMFGRATPEAVHLPYCNFVKPGVRFVKETITAIDPAARRATTTGGTHEADFLVVALGAAYDLAATPGLAEDGNEFYSVAGARRVREVLPAFADPERWTTMMRASIRMAVERFSSDRMVREYFARLYAAPRSAG
jgi:sulfide:quinone oxidoreductase